MLHRKHRNSHPSKLAMRTTGNTPWWARFHQLLCRHEARCSRRVLAPRTANEKLALFRAMRNARSTGEGAKLVPF